MISMNIAQSQKDKTFIFNHQSGTVSVNFCSLVLLHPPKDLASLRPLATQGPRIIVPPLGGTGNEQIVSERHLYHIFPTRMGPGPSYKRSQENLVNGLINE